MPPVGQGPAGHGTPNLYSRPTGRACEHRPPCVTRRGWKLWGGSEVGGGGSTKLTPQSQGSKRLGVCEPRAHPSFMGKCHR